MTKREQYNLVFSKFYDQKFKRYRYACKHIGEINQYNELQFLQRFDNAHETLGLIDEINMALNGQYYEEYFSTDSTEDIEIRLLFPNVIFGENDLTIPMIDLEELLQEWLEFIKN